MVCASFLDAALGLALLARGFAECRFAFLDRRLEARQLDGRSSTSRSRTNAACTVADEPAATDPTGRTSTPSSVATAAAMATADNTLGDGEILDDDGAAEEGVNQPPISRVAADEAGRNADDAALLDQIQRAELLHVIERIHCRVAVIIRDEYGERFLEVELTFDDDRVEVLASAASIAFSRPGGGLTNQLTSPRIPVSSRSGAIVSRLMTPPASRIVRTPASGASGRASSVSSSSMRTLIDSIRLRAPRKSSSMASCFAADAGDVLRLACAIGDCPVELGTCEGRLSRRTSVIFGPGRQSRHDRLAAIYSIDRRVRGEGGRCDPARCAREIAPASRASARLFAGPSSTGSRRSPHARRRTSPASAANSLPSTTICAARAVGSNQSVSAWNCSKTLEARPEAPDAGVRTILEAGGVIKRETDRPRPRTHRDPGARQLVRQTAARLEKGDRGRAWREPPRDRRRT